MNNIEELKLFAQQVRIDIVDMINTAGSGHLGGSLSCVEILTVLYNNVMNIKIDEPHWADRDRFILSKGHAAPALYATLIRRGLLDFNLLNRLRKLDSPLQGHPSMLHLQNVDMSTGSLGMGISVGVGMSLAARQLGKNYRVYVLCGDGELNEGQNWEGLMAAAKWNLANLTIIIDYNRVQLDGGQDEIMPLGDIVSKFESFGMYTMSCDGHDIQSLLEAFQIASVSDRPTVIIAHTIKGKGVSFMEGKAEWHGKVMTEQEYMQAIEELKRGWHNEH